MDEKEKNISDVDMNTETEQEIKEETVNEEILEGENSFEAKLAEAEALAKENFDKYLRQVAEFENYRKRTTAEKSSMYSNGVRDTVEKLLPVLDNFERAINSTEDKDNTLYVGVEMILKQFNEMLTALGVEEIPAEGEPFDPNLHNAVMHIEDDKCDTNVVVEVFQKGYKMGDKVIRHSMVKVAN
jgi:molecular chaperone GrpE